MSRYSVADAKNNLPRLIDKALEGEEVVITRHGKPVVELRPATAARTLNVDYNWLRKRRDSRPASPIDSVSLLNSLYESDEP